MAARKRQGARVASEVETSYGRMIDFDAAMNVADPEIVEELHGRLAPCTDQEFYDAYCEAHIDRYDDEFEPDKPNGQW